MVIAMHRIGLIWFFGGWGLLMGCSLNPSSDDVLVAMEASLRSMNQSMQTQHLKIHETYGWGAYLSYVNEDHSLLHTVKVAVDDNSVSISGECIFADYQDTVSPYALNGDLSYQLKLPRNFNPTAGSGDVRCTLALAGGKVKNLQYNFRISPNGQFTRFDVAANGKSMDMSRYRQALNFMKYISPLNL
jgi:hypothetical protein